MKKYFQNPEYIEDKVKEITSDLLNLYSGDALNLDRSFLELGINSMLAIELMEAINQRLGIKLGVEAIFDYRGIKELAEYISNHYGKQCQAKGIENASTIHSKKDTISVKKEEKEENNNRQTSFLEEKDSDIAIIGISGRFAGSETIEEFWEHLQTGESCIEEIKRKGWEESRYYDPDPSQKNKSISKWGGMLKNIDKFDALFFNISPFEAERMDPQQRLFLEEAFKAFEDGGYSTEQLSGKKVGVFVGGQTSDYKEKTLSEIEKNAYTFLGNEISILTARLSYFLNLKGPSLAIDTACSSSLVAIHLACESIRRWESEIALAGGVFILSSPEFYVMTSKTNMLSPDGKCKTFDNSANGIVIGEGVGALVLKRLEAAIKDGDHIYGVIKGSAINQDGKTKGITAPRMLSQKALIYELYKNASIHPETVSYIEAHGTGTKLGDPIEIKALTEAFRIFTDKTQFCAVGSHKPNFGHTIMSSGIAGVFTILMAMKHRKIPPVISLQEVNEYIDLNGSPFFINTKLREWKSSNRSALRAGVSSFGFSGTNCHVIIEEPPVQKNITHNQVKPYYLFPFSAKTKTALIQKVVDMNKLLEKKAKNYPPEDISYTLLMGRSYFPVRCVFIAEDIEELKQRITEVSESGTTENYLKNEENDCFKIDSILEPILKEHGEQVIQELLENSNLTGKEYKEKLLFLSLLYIKGINLNWGNLFKKGKFHRIPLPTYPFNGESYWIPKSEKHYNFLDYDYIHPLLHQNTSDFSEQRFTSTFTGNEFFLIDHVVNGQPVLPGVAYLEMARAAVEQAVGGLEEGRTGIRLKNVVWARPIVVEDEPVKVHIGLFPEDSREINYEIYSEPVEANAEPVVHSHGSVVLSSVAEVPALDLKALQAQCCQGNLSPPQCYEAFKAMRLHYGPGHQGIEKLYTGRDLVLAKLSLPSSVSDTQEQFILHPSMMDSALQASIGLMTGTGDTIPSDSIPRKPVLPFALKEIEIFDSCTPAMWAVIQYSEGSQAGGKVEKLDIDLCDETGKVCVRMKGFSSRVLEGDIQTINVSKETYYETPVESLVGTLMLTPVWDVVHEAKIQNFPNPSERVVIVGEDKDKISATKQHYPEAEALKIQPNDTVDAIAHKIEAHDSIDHILWIAPHSSLVSLTDDALIEDQNRGVLQVFRIIKALLRMGYGARDLGWTVITIQAQHIHKKDLVNPTHASLHGLIGAMAKEYPNWKIRLVDLETDCAWPVKDIFTLPPDPQGNALAYRGGEWYCQQLIPFHHPPLKQTLYKEQGVYVMIGGAGGIGEAWSEYMIRTFKAQIIWLGRRQKDASIQAKLDRLASLGPAPHYISADATDQKALQKAYEEIKQQYSQINGVIHSAIVLLDKSLANMEEERFRAGLSAKVDVSVRMAQVFQKEPLDFALFFSSLNSFSKSPGQSNYAAGCIFEDAFAHQLAHEWSCKVKVMNWGYWGGVGVVASKAYQDRMAQAGIDSIEPPEAMEALETLLAGPFDQIGLIKTTKPLSVEGMNQKELIVAYKEGISLSIENLQGRIPTLPKPNNDIVATYTNLNYR